MSESITDEIVMSKIANWKKSPKRWSFLDKSNAHTKYLAKSILEYIVAEAVIFKASVVPFKSSALI